MAATKAVATNCANGLSDVCVTESEPLIYTALLKGAPSFDRRFCERPFPPVTIAARCSGVGLACRWGAPRFDGER
jgi:hypothetical protein